VKPHLFNITLDRPEATAGMKWLAESGFGDLVVIDDGTRWITIECDITDEDMVTLSLHFLRDANFVLNYRSLWN